MRPTINIKDNLDTASYLGAIITVIISVVVIVGWAIQSELLITLNPGYAPLQPNGALCLLLLGGATLVRNSSVKVITALICGLIACLQAIEYIYPIGISTILIDPWYTAHTARPGMLSVELIASIGILSSLSVISYYIRGPLKQLICSALQLGFLVGLQIAIIFYYAVANHDMVVSNSIYTLLSYPATLGVWGMILYHYSRLRGLFHGP